MSTEDPTTYLNAESSRCVGICQCHCYLLDHCFYDFVLVEEAYLQSRNSQRVAGVSLHHVLPPAWWDEH
jgi:hypothetical protein